MVEIIKKSINHHWLTLPLQQRPDNYSYNFRNSLRKSWICFRTAENPTSFHFNILLLLSNSLHRGIWNSQVRSPVLVEIRRWLGLKVKLSHSRFSRKPDVKDLDSFRLICISSISYTHLLYIYNHLHMSTKLNKCFFSVYYNVIRQSGKCVDVFVGTSCQKKTQLLQLNRGWNDVTEGANLPVCQWQRKKYSNGRRWVWILEYSSF